MKLPVVQGRIERRLLVNFRVAPEILARELPAPFRPQIYRGSGLAGICIIRLTELRPRFLPRPLGWRLENAAHRVAAEWEQDGQICRGVYVQRRDTNSRLAAAVGGRLFPGVHSLADFTTVETPSHFEVAMRSRDGQVDLAVAADVASELPPTSIFRSLAEASAFFEAGSVGYSPTSDADSFQGLELRCRQWSVQPLAVHNVRSSYFDDRTRFPADSIQFDCALLMQNVEHQWHACGELARRAQLAASTAV